MKKLIDELNLLSMIPPSGEYADGYSSGVNDAISIVRAHNPWHEVGELPPIDEKEPDFSIDVMVTNGNGYRLGYYSFRTESWVIHRYFRNPSKVTHWTHLPELPK